MPARIRRAPLLERIKAHLDPADFLLWLSEEFESRGLDQLEKEWAIPVGVGLNFVFIVARANSGSSSASGGGYGDDVFGDSRSGPSFYGWLASFMVHSLAFASFVNAAFTFWRKRHYRLFEASVDTVPSTPSARRVRVDSSPISSSPLRFLSSMLSAGGAESRSHPDAQRDVWELAVWDPLPICLSLFCYFSPGHVLIYWLSLPPALSDSRPSMTIVIAILCALTLSLQLSYLQSSFSRQQKDSALISKEVLHEYDTKFVHPRTRPTYRDVGTQFSLQAANSVARDDKYNFVETYAPAVVVNRGFQTRPNPNYTKHTDPDNHLSQPGYHRGPAPAPSSTPFTNPATPALRSTAPILDSSSPFRPSTTIKQPQFKPVPEARGGSLGAYTHANSPAKRRPFGQSENMTMPPPPEYRRSQSPGKRPASPEKRMSVPALGFNIGTSAASRRWGHLQQSPRRDSGRF